MSTKRASTSGASVEATLQKVALVGGVGTVLLVLASRGVAELPQAAETTGVAPALAGYAASVENAAAGVTPAQAITWGALGLAALWVLR